MEENNRIVKNLSINVENLNKGLEDEITLRKNIQTELDKNLADKINGKFQVLKGMLWLSTALLPGVAALIIAWLAGILDL